MSKIIRAQADQPEPVTSFGFAELQQERRSPAGIINQVGGIAASAGAPATPFEFSELQQERRSPSGITNRMGGAGTSFGEPPPPVDIEASVHQLLLNAERKAQELEEEAYRKGYEQGQKDGFEVGQKSMAIVKEHLEKLLDSMQSAPQSVLANYREWLIQMCLTISRHIVRRELTTDSTQLGELIETLLGEAVEGHTLTVNLHPYDLALLEQHLDLGKLAERTGRTFTLKAHPRIERGGCRVESDIQVFDASIEKRFSFIEQALRNDGPIADEIPA